MGKIHLIIGGARSGKSSLAERYAKLSNFPVTYVATAQAHDDEMQQRISQHQADRPKHWQLIESPLFLANAMESAIANNRVEQGESAQGICLLVDCLTLWLTNCLCKPNLINANTDEANLDYWQHEKQQLLSLLESIQLQDNVDIILVSNEVGHGIVPMGELSRQFVDQAGWLHQALAGIADNVEFVMAGLPIILKSNENAQQG